MIAIPNILAASMLVGLATWAATPAEVGKAEADAFNFAQGLYVHRDFKSAIEEFRAFLAKHPASPRVAEARYRLADALFQERDFAAAVVAYDEALAKHPEHGESGRAFYNLGRSHYRLDAFAAALAAFRKAAAVDGPQLAEEAMVGIGESLSRLEKYPEAVACYGEFVDRFPASDHLGNVLFALGWTQAQVGNHEAAAIALRRLLADCPQFPEIGKARLALSDSLAALNQYQAAAEALQPLAGDVALQPDVRLRQAWNYFNSQQFAAAAEAFASFATNYPDHRLAGSARFNAGIALYQAGQFEAALTPLQAALTAGGDAAQLLQARYWLGLSQFNLGRHGEAVATLAPLLGVADGLTAEQQAGVVWHSARANIGLGDSPAAIKLYRDFLARQPDAEVAPTMTYALAVEQDAGGDPAAAVATLAAGLPAMPPGELRRKALFALAEFHYRLQQPAAAAPLLEELLATTPPPADPKVLYRQAWVTFDCRQFAQAENRFASLAKGDSEFAAEARFMQARALEELDRAAEAVPAYLAYLEGTDERPWREEAYCRLAFLLPVEARNANLEAYARRFPNGKFLPEMRLKLAEDLFAQGQTAAAGQLYTLAADAPAAPPAIRRAALYGQAWVALKEERFDQANQRFQQVRQTQADDDMGQDATLQLAEIAYRGGHLATAAPLFAELVDTPRHGERATYMLAWSQRQAGDAATAATAFARLLERWPTGEFAADAALRQAQILHAAGDSATAVALLDHGRFADSPWREEALHLLCDALATTADWQALAKQAETVRREFPESERRHLATFNLARAYHELGLHDQAEAHYLQTIEETDTIEAAKAQFNLGALRFAKQQYAEAARLFLRVDMLYDYRELAAKALYHAADAFARAGDDDRAAMYRQRLRETHPDSEWAKK